MPVFDKKRAFFCNFPPILDQKLVKKPFSHIVSYLRFPTILNPKNEQYGL